MSSVNKIGFGLVLFAVVLVGIILIFNAVFVSMFSNNLLKNPHKVTTTSTVTTTINPVQTFPVNTVAITLTNSQPVTTVAPFQYRLLVPSSKYSQYINSQWSNVEFTTGPDASNTVLQAWVESGASNTAPNTTVWVNLPNGIPASGSVTIYMNFMKNPVMSYVGPTGEAPQLSSSYGQYDNGAYVFSFYDNFAGTSLSNKWGYTAINGTLTINNGATLYTNKPGGVVSLIAGGSRYANGKILEAAMNVFGSSGTDIRDRIIPAGIQGLSVSDFGYYSQGSGSRPQYFWNGTYTSVAVPLSSSSTVYNILDRFTFGQAGAFNWTSMNYQTQANIYSNQGTISAGSNFTPNYQAAADPSGTDTVSEENIEFVRIRNAPPNGVMPSASFSGVTSYQNQYVPPSVCATLYVWYGYNLTSQKWTGGIGSSHWNNGPYGVVEDTPVAGYYSSMAEIPTQLQEMWSAGINCVVVDWWGYGIDNFSQQNNIDTEAVAFNNATKEVFADARSVNPQMKVVLLVDAFSSNMNASDYGQVYSYINKTFYAPYSSELLQWNGKPLIIWFNPMNPTNDNRFTSRVIGSNLNFIYPGWFFWDAPQSDFNSYSGSATDPCPECYYGPQPPSPDGFVGAMPRYDDYYLSLSGARRYYMRVDYNYSEGLYQTEWNYAINQSNMSKVKMVFIYSWNEYHERSEIEPHTDYTAAGTSPYYLYNLTKKYITEIEST